MVYSGDYHYPLDCGYNGCENNSDPQLRNLLKSLEKIAVFV
ncbi:hypothetical protein [Ligilactobacillus equi]|nr:hypothetical protein [Ligilactobacillus equi]